MPTNSKFLETVYSLNYSILGDIVVAHSFKRTHINQMKIKMTNGLPIKV